MGSTVIITPILEIRNQETESLSTCPSSQSLQGNTDQIQTQNSIHTTLFQLHKYSLRRTQNMIHQPKLSTFTAGRWTQHWGVSAAAPEYSYSTGLCDSGPVLSTGPTPISGSLKFTIHGTSSSAPTHPHTSPGCIFSTWSLLYPFIFSNMYSSPS